MVHRFFNRNILMFVFPALILITDYAAFSKVCRRLVKISSIRGEVVEYHWDDGKKIFKEIDK
ncbi:MAG: hypothetical protein MI799_02875 [Desulfobacterales bacterium]|nr:hypothetical protein [Desulfobacterales bacterium]